MNFKDAALQVSEEQIETANLIGGVRWSIDQCFPVSKAGRRTRSDTIPTEQVILE